MKERLVAPHVLSCNLSGFDNHYKLKLRASGYRLVYEVIDKELFILVVAVGKREKGAVYEKVRERS